jgi:hypothetical protein
MTFLPPLTDISETTGPFPVGPDVKNAKCPLVSGPLGATTSPEEAGAVCTST